MKKEAITNIAWSTLLIGGMFALVAITALARGTETGTTFATEGIDLKIDSRAFYNHELVGASSWALKNLVPASDHFFNFDDIKPGDSGKTIISMHIKKTDAWLCLDFKNLKSADWGVNEPEGNADDDSELEGELASGMEFFAWIDDGDNVFEIGERPLFGTSTQSATEVLHDKTYPIGDSKNATACRVNDTRYVGIFWCAGNLSINFATALLSCDGSVLGNSSQTDALSVDISIRARPSKENPRFICSDSKAPDQPPEDDDDSKDEETPDQGRTPREPRAPREPREPKQSQSSGNEQ